MIPVYNCMPFLKETLKSVLIQDAGTDNMQIEVIDDCSTDGDVESLVTAIGKGRISYYRQSLNTGSLRNFETCINRSKGKWIHLLHGDDAVKNGFYKEIETLIKEYPAAGAAFTGCTYIDENSRVGHQLNSVQSSPGIIKDWLLKIAKHQLLEPPSIVIKREVYEQLGGYFGVHYGEDWEMYTRIASHFPVVYTPENLALYRVHNRNISSQFLASGQSVKDIRKVMSIIQNYLPVHNRKSILASSKKHFSIYFARKAHFLYKLNGRSKMATQLAHAALSLNGNLISISLLIKLYIKLFINLGK
jgi:glycosyltransferase involved in cell wall biosynthesis